MQSLATLAGGAERLVVVDTETTGVYNSDRVVEIALVTVGLDGTVVDRWETLLQPDRDVSASFIHGITAEMVAGAPRFADVAGDIAVRLQGACLVAHNLSFDLRMLGNEYERLGAGLSVPAGICTLRAAGCRLELACMLNNISLDGAHRALNDAVATAELLTRIADQCERGSPASAPVHLGRSGRVMRREDTVATLVPDPPLVTRLMASLDLTGLEANTLSYLDVVARSLADLHLDRDERTELQHLATTLGLNQAQVHQAHRRFVNQLVDAAIEDDEVTPQEYEALIRSAHALEIDQQTVESRIRPYREHNQLVTLTEGMKVVLTGDHPDFERSYITRCLEQIGLEVQRNVTKKTDLLAAVDPASNSGKAKKARTYSVPVINVDDLLGAKLGSNLTAVGVEGAAKVITCPDCLDTRLASATSGAASHSRCASCAELATARQPAMRDRAWTPPTSSG